MSYRGLKTLQLIAVILWGVALLLTIIAIPLQVPVKQLYLRDATVAQAFVIPWQTLIGLTVHLALAVILLILIITCRDKASTKGLVILLAVLWGVWGAVLSPLISMGITMLINAQSIETTASYSVLTSAISLFTGPISTAGSIMTLIALGGFYRNQRKQTAANAPAQEE